MSPDAPGLVGEGLVRSFGAATAVDGIDLHLRPGEVLALFGPNGAGKSTLLRLLAGALRPDAGTLRLDGVPLDTRSPDWLARVGVLSHRGFLYPHLTARENLRFYADLYGLPHPADRIAERLAAVGLEARADDRVRGFSRGMAQRLALARALLHDPEIVLLDEPWTGLDVHAAALLRGVLESLRDGRRIVLLVTHNLTEGLALADRIAIQVRGRWALDRPARDIEAEGFPALYRRVVEGEAA